MGEEEGEKAVEPQEEPAEAPAEQPKEPEKEPEVKKKGKGIVARIKNWIIIILLLIIIVPAGTFFLWKLGVDDLKTDNTILIVVQEQGVAKAGSIYDINANKAEVINVEELPAVTNLGLFFREASKKRKIDRLVLIRVRTVSKLSTEPSLNYAGREIPSIDVGGYIIGTYWDADLAGNDPPWMFRANLLSEWVELYSTKIQDASFGSHVYNVLFTEYRNGGIVVYPRNTALIIVRFVPVEQILL